MNKKFVEFLKLIVKMLWVGFVIDGIFFGFCILVNMEKFWFFYFELMIFE